MRAHLDLTFMQTILVMIMAALHSIDRAASLHVCGKQMMHTELRVRTVCELVGNKEYYLRPEVTSFHGGFTDDRKCHGRLHATSANYANPSLQHDPSTSNLEQEISYLTALTQQKMVL